MVAEQDGVHIDTMDADVDTVIERLKQAIKDSPASLMTVFDPQENADQAGMDLPPTTVLVFGNPALGTPLLRKHRTLALDLPQRMLVYDDNGTTKIVHNDPAHLFDRHGVDDEETQNKIADLLHGLVQQARQP